LADPINIIPMLQQDQLWQLQPRGRRARLAGNSAALAALRQGLARSGVSGLSFAAAAFRGRMEYHRNVEAATGPSVRFTPGIAA
jgi:hypothetical protein